MVIYSKRNVCNVVMHFLKNMLRHYQHQSYIAGNVFKKNVVQNAKIKILKIARDVDIAINTRIGLVKEKRNGLEYEMDIG